MNYLRADMIDTANLQKTLKELEAIRDNASAAIPPLRALIGQLANAGTAGVAITPRVDAPAVKPTAETTTPQETGKGKGYSDAIPYSDELASWIKDQATGYTISDFHDFLSRKYGAHMVNDQSIRNPFRRFTKEGRIVVVKEPSGRRPAVYQTGPIQP